MENAGCVGVKIVRARVPLRDQPPADRFGDRLRAVDRSERRAHRPQSLAAPCGGEDFSREAFENV